MSELFEHKRQQPEVTNRTKNNDNGNKIGNKECVVGLD